jgi:hypothetical protein
MTFIGAKRALLGGFRVPPASFFLPLIGDLNLSSGTGPASYSRPSAATVWGYPEAANSGASQVLLTIPSGVPRFEGARFLASNNTWSTQFADGAPIPSDQLHGYYHEGLRTNLLLWNRDLTNAAWSKTNCTAAKNQTGIDGAANSASSLTATAANATCLQTLTRASAVRDTGLWIKRLAGSGTVQLTQNGGTTWTPLTVTSDWSFVSLASATLANPVIGLQIATSGDSVAVDYVQHEEAAFVSSPIATTSATVTRSADSLTVPLANFSDTAGTAYAEIKHAAWLEYGRIFGGSNTPLNVDLNGNTIGIYDGTSVSRAIRTKSTLQPVASRWGNSKKKAFASGASLGEGSYYGSFSLSGNLEIGGSGMTGVNVFYGTLRNLKLWNYALSDLLLVRVTT